MELRDSDAGGRPEGPGTGVAQNSPVRFLIKGDGLQETYNGFGDGLTLAFEIALVPTILGFIGYGVDRLLGTLPVFTIVLAVAGVIGLSTRLFYDYAARMKEHEAEGPWAKSDEPARPIDLKEHVSVTGVEVP